MRAWSESKGRLADLLGADQDFLHVPFGLLLFVILAVAFRKQKHPLLVSLAALTGLQFVNELLDGIQWWLWTGTIAWGEAVEDTGLTIGLPLCAVIIACMAARRRLQDNPTTTGARQDPDGVKPVGAEIQKFEGRFRSRN
ncbi:hypothetical protein [Roseicyclus sp.]